LTLRGGDQAARLANPLLLFQAVLTVGTEEKVQDIIRNVPVTEQSERICGEWGLSTHSCEWFREQLEYSVKREVDAHHSDTRETLTTPFKAQQLLPREPEWNAAPPQSLLDSITRPQLREKLQAYAALHAQALRDGPEKGGKFLLCQPTSGFGNQFNAIMSCFALALATDRAMLLDWEAVLAFNGKWHPNGPQYVIGTTTTISMQRAASRQLWVYQRPAALSRSIIPSIDPSIHPLKRSLSLPHSSPSLSLLKVSINCSPGRFSTGASAPPSCSIQV